MNLLKEIWRHHLPSNKVGQNSRPLDNIHFKFSAICVKIYEQVLNLACVIFSFLFFNPTPFVFLKDISCYLYGINKSHFHVIISHSFIFLSTLAKRYLSEPGKRTNKRIPKIERSDTLTSFIIGITVIKQFIFKTYHGTKIILLLQNARTQTKLM